MENTLEIKNSDYPLWKDELINQIHLRQLKTVININTETLNNYFEIGKQILAAQNEKGWGSHVIDQLSDVEKNQIWQVPPAELKETEQIMQVPLAQITWYHHISLISKVKDKVC